MIPKEQALPRVLIADDQKDMREAIQERLRILPARVDTASDGNSAIEALLSAFADGDPYSLIILDMRMPVSPALEAGPTVGLSALKNYQLLARTTPVIVYTAYENYRNCVDCIKAGAYDYLPKLVERGKSNLPTLFNRCREVLYPKPDEFSQWVKDHLAELKACYGGKFVCLVEDDRSEQQAGDEWIAVGAADSIRDIRITLLKDPGLRWKEPKILKVPRQ